MRIINIVDRLDRVNFGIWNAAIATARELKAGYGIDSEVWYPAATDAAEDAELNGARRRPLDRLDMAALDAAVHEAGLDPQSDAIVSHGCWQYPTRWGRELRRRGFRWVAVPHGMLEQWSLSQKRLRKAVYLRLVERPALRRADYVRAVGKPEFARLRRVFGDRTVWIPNGVPGGDGRQPAPKPPLKAFLFMARLHHKKGVLPLVEGWLASPLCNHPDYRLRIAGPDDGELPALRAFLDAHPEVTNIHYLGPVYGADKLRLLEESRFYILPSFSEGFPTSVLEAMWHGLIPLVTEGCNFPDVFEQQLGIRVEPDAGSVRRGLEAAHALDDAAMDSLSRRARACIEGDYTYDRIAARQAALHDPRYSTKDTHDDA